MPLTPLKVTSQLIAFGVNEFFLGRPHLLQRVFIDLAVKLDYTECFSPVGHLKLLTLKWHGCHSVSSLIGAVIPLSSPTGSDKTAVAALHPG